MVSKPTEIFEFHLRCAAVTGNCDFWGETNSMCDVFLARDANRRVYVDIEDLFFPLYIEFVLGKKMKRASIFT